MRPVAVARARCVGEALELDRPQIVVLDCRDGSSRACEAGVSRGWSVTSRTADLFAEAVFVAARVGAGKPQVVVLIILG
jgi:hypothetical protein